MSKRMTAREKDARAAIRKELREKGLIPPKKKPLDRVEFCKEAEAILKGMNITTDGLYIAWALMEMLEHTGGGKTNGRSLEAVGAAKAIKLAAARQDFERERRDRGEPKEYTLGELYAVVKDIFEA